MSPEDRMPRLQYALVGLAMAGFMAFLAYETGVF